MEVGLVSCTKSKLDEAALPKDLYTKSAYFRKARAYSEQNHNCWYILSAKHHLLKPDGPKIEPYDETLTDVGKEERRKWAETAVDQLDSENLLRDDVTLVIHAGRVYYSELLPLLPQNITVRIPTEGHQFGETLSWYNEHLD